jgi:serine/threonine protein kinase
MGMIGRIIDRRYEILEEIGRGGFAIVYRGRDIKLHDRPVAIKYLRPENAENAAVLGMFSAEIQVSARLRDTRIAQIYDTVEEQGDHFVVFEFVDGADLKQLVLRARERPDTKYSKEFGPRVPPQFAAYVILEVCLALEYAHTLEDTARQVPLNIVHRDISPQNILLSFNGDVKLTDFGIAKARDQMTEQTKTGVVKGKYSYMSPEQIQCQRLDHTSDLYSLGIVFYEILSGEKLYSGDSEIELMKRVAKGGIDRDRLNSKFIPPPLRKVLSRALDPDRNLRYQSGAEMAGDLAEFLAGQRNLHQELAHYVQVLFKPEVAEVIEPTQTVQADRTPPRPARPSEAGTSTVELPKPEPTVAPTAEQPAAEGERTIIDIIRVTAYSGRRFFAIGAIVLVSVLLVLLALDVFLGRNLWRHRTKLGRTIYFALFPPSAEITSFPPHAEVWVGDMKLDGTTPVQVSRLQPGEYDVVLKQPGYEPIREQRSIRPSGGNKLVRLDFAFDVPVDVASTPPGATVVWNGRPRGPTPTSFRQTMNGEAVQVELQHEGFEPIRGEVNFAEGPPAQPDRSLVTTSGQDSSGMTRWNVAGVFSGVRRFKVVPEDAKVVLQSERDTVPVSLTGGVATLLVPYGSHRVVATSAGFVTVNHDFKVERGDTADVMITLRRSIRVYVYDAENNERLRGSEVRIGGDRYSEGEQVGLAPGAYRVQVSAKGYESQNGSITISRDQQTDYTFKLGRGESEAAVTVYEGGNPAPGIWVWAVPDNGPDEFLGITSVAGQIHTTKLEGTYWFKMSREGTVGVTTPEQYIIEWGKPNDIRLEYVPPKAPTPPQQPQKGKR